MAFYIVEVDNDAFGICDSYGNVVGIVSDVDGYRLLTRAKLDGYSTGPLPVMLVSPNMLGTSLDGYSIGRLPTFSRIDGYSIDDLPVRLVSPNRVSTSIDGYSTEFVPVKLVSPNRVGTSIDGYSIGPLPMRTTAGSVVRIIDAYGNDVSVQDAFNWFATHPGILAMGKDTTTSPTKVRDLVCDSAGRLVVVSAGTSAPLAGFAFGQAVLSATTPVPVRSQAYTEQSSDAQRSLVSSSANDAAAGTGARTVKITYYTSALVGPKTEIVTLNGTTPVNTANSDICYIEKMEVLTAGASATVPVGTISLKAAAAGGGVTIWSIAAGEGRTFGAHHYVQTGMICHITGFEGGIKGADTAGFYLKSADLTTPGSPGFERQISETLRAPSSGNTPIRTFGTAIEVVGPARVTLYTAPDSTSRRTYYGSFDFYEQ